MKTTIRHRASTGVVGKGITGLAAATLLASVAVTVLPTAASAFNIEGLIGAAMAGRYGGYHHGRSYSHHARSHESSRRSRDHDGDRDSSSKDERDARDQDATAHAKSDGGANKPATHAEPSVLQASQSDVPAFAPSR